MAIRIVCINKDNGNHENPHVAIEALGWIEDGTNTRGRWKRTEMYDWIVHKNGIAYVSDWRGNRAYLEGRVSVRGNKYVQTHADGKLTNNLLELSPCA